MDYGYYVNRYRGTSVPQEQWDSLWRRAKEYLDSLRQRYWVSGGEEAQKMAICAVAEVMDYFDSAQNGQGGLRYASIGSVSVSGKGIYSQVDISPAAREKELYHAARMYLDIYRGVGQ